MLGRQSPTIGHTIICMLTVPFPPQQCLPSTRLDERQCQVSTPSPASLTSCIRRGSHFCSRGMGGDRDNSAVQASMTPTSIWEPLGWLSDLEESWPAQWLTSWMVGRHTPFPSQTTGLTSHQHTLYGYGNTDRRSFLLIKVANRLIPGLHHLANTGRINSSCIGYGIIWPTRNRVSAWTLHALGKWTGTSWIPFWSGSLRSWIACWVNLYACMIWSHLPCWCSTLLWNCRTSVTARETRGPSQ